MIRTFHLAILECDIPMPSLITKYGTYGDMFERILRPALKSLEATTGKDIFDLRISKYDVHAGEEYPNPEQIDGLLLTGSKYSIYDDLPWIGKLSDFLREAHTNYQLPIIGVCFGHQLAAKALGAKAELNPLGWEISVGEQQLSDLGTQVFGKSPLTLHQMHRDAVLSLPPGCQILGSSARCDIQGYYMPDRLFCIQGHPEFDEYIMKKILDLRLGQNMFTPEQHGDASVRAALSHDGPVVAKAMIKFLANSSRVCEA